MKSFTAEEVAKHNTEDSFWLIIDNLVYDLTAFLGMHPGGELILHPYGGKDATFVIRPCGLQLSFNQLVAPSFMNCIAEMS